MRPPGREIDWPTGGSRRGADRRRRRLVAAALALAAGVIALVLVLGRGRGDEPDGTTVEAMGQWRPMAAAPLSPRIGAAGDWTGRELVLWGGRPCLEGRCDDETVEALADGAAYDPAADTWRPLAPSSLQARRGNVAVWSGRELLVWGGGGGTGAFFFGTGPATTPRPTLGGTCPRRPVASSPTPSGAGGRCWCGAGSSPARDRPRWRPPTTACATGPDPTGRTATR
jgi:hypothetical protein